MPDVPASAVLTWPALGAVETTSMGSPDPAGKYLDSTLCAAMDGGVPRNDWATVRVPNLNPIIPAAPAASRIAVTIHTVRGRRAMAWPTRDQNPRLVGSAEPKSGLTGQKIHRPKITRTSGSSGIIAIRPTAIPTAATPPSPEMALDSA